MKIPSLNVTDKSTRYKRRINSLINPSFVPTIRAIEIEDYSDTHYNVTTYVYANGSFNLNFISEVLVPKETVHKWPTRVTGMFDSEEDDCI